MSGRRPTPQQPAPGDDHNNSIYNPSPRNNTPQLLSAERRTYGNQCNRQVQAQQQAQFAAQTQVQRYPQGQQQAGYFDYTNTVTQQQQYASPHRGMVGHPSSTSQSLHLHPISSAHQRDDGRGRLPPSQPFSTPCPRAPQLRAPAPAPASNQRTIGGIPIPNQNSPQEPLQPQPVGGHGDHTPPGGNRGMPANVARDPATGRFVSLNPARQRSYQNLAAQADQQANFGIAQQQRRGQFANFGILPTQQQRAPTVGQLLAPPQQQQRLNVSRHYVPTAYPHLIQQDQGQLSPYQCQQQQLTSTIQWVRCPLTEYNVDLYNGGRVPNFEEFGEPTSRTTQPMSQQQRERARRGLERWREEVGWARLGEKGDIDGELGWKGARMGVRKRPKD